MFTPSKPWATPAKTSKGAPRTSTTMPENAGSWLNTMRSAAAFTKPITTGWLRRFTIPASCSARKPHNTSPTCRHSTEVMARYASECAGAWAPTAAATINAAMATGPTTSWREEPNTA